MHLFKKKFEKYLVDLKKRCNFVGVKGTGKPITDIRKYTLSKE